MTFSFYHNQSYSIRHYKLLACGLLMVIGGHFIVDLFGSG